MPAQYIFDPRITEASRPYDMTKMFDNLSENLQRRRGVEDRKEQIRQKLELDMAKGLLPKANIEIGDNGEFLFDNDAAKRAFYSALAPKQQDDLSREASGELTETLMPSTLDAKIERAQNQSAQDPTAVALANAARAMALNIQERTNPGLIFGPNTPILLQQGGVMSPTNMPTQPVQQPSVQPATQPTAEPTPAPAPSSTTTVQGGFGSVTLPANPLTVSQPPAPAQPAPAPAYTPLSVGARGAAVKAMQKALGLKEDGVFGPNTMAKLKDYQTKNGLQATGQIDQATAAKLNLPAESSTTTPTGRFSTKDQKQIGLQAGQLEQMTAKYKSPDIDVSEERYSVKQDTRQRARFDEVKEGLRSLAGASSLADISNTIGEGTGINRKSPSENVYKTLFNERVAQLKNYETASKEDLPSQQIVKLGKEEYKVTGADYDLSAREAAKVADQRTIVTVNNQGDQRSFDEMAGKVYFPGVSNTGEKVGKQVVYMGPGGALMMPTPLLPIKARHVQKGETGTIHYWNDKNQALADIRDRLVQLANSTGATYEIEGTDVGNSRVVRTTKLGKVPVAQINWRNDHRQATLNGLSNGTIYEISTITGFNYNTVGGQEEAPGK